MRFNTATVDPTKTTNLAGGEAFQQDKRLEFVSILLTNFVKDTYYRKGDDTISRIVELIGTIPDKRFLAKAAIYARQKYGMRTVSHIVAGELAKTVKGEAWTKRFLQKVVHRPDDMMEILAYYRGGNTKTPDPNCIRKGFAAVLEGLDEYQLAKYKGEGKQVNIYDLVNVCHPKATPSLSKLMKGELKPAETWESKLTIAGQQAETDEGKAELKKEAWAELIKDHRLGYFAALRNARNILEQAPESVDKLCAILTDERAIKKSLVLPFRFVTAVDEILKTNYDGTRKVLVALSDAIDKSVANVPKFDGKTLVVLDCSGSMQGDPAKIGSLFAAVLVKSNDAELMLFADRAAYKTVNPLDTTATIANSIKFASGGTNFHSIFQTTNKQYERIIILSDMQGWVGYNTPALEFKSYRQRYNCQPKVYSFDLQNYGTMQFPEKDVYCLAGWSDKVFDIMKMLETDRQALIHEIEAISL